MVLWKLEPLVGPPLYTLPWLQQMIVEAGKNKKQKMSSFTKLGQMYYVKPPNPWFVLLLPLSSLETENSSPILIPDKLHRNQKDFQPVNCEISFFESWYPNVSSSSIKFWELLKCETPALLYYYLLTSPPIYFTSFDCFVPWHLKELQ